MHTFNPNEPGIAQFVILYLLFQVGLATYLRIASKIQEKDNEKPIVSRNDYLILIIPLFGILYAVFGTIRFCLRK